MRKSYLSRMKLLFFVMIFAGSGMVLTAQEADDAKSSFLLAPVELVKQYSRVLRLFARFDVKNENRVLMAGLPKRVKNENLKQLESLDKNNDQILTLDEVRNSFNGELSVALKKLPDQILAKFDANKDGKLSLEDLSKDSHREKAAQLINFFDNDNSGAVEQSELNALMPYLTAFVISKRLEKIRRFMGKELQQLPKVAQALVYLLDADGDLILSEKEILLPIENAFGSKVAELLTGKKIWPDFTQSREAQAKINVSDNPEVEQSKEKEPEKAEQRQLKSPPSEWDYVVSKMAATKSVKVSKKDELSDLTNEPEGDVLW